MHAVLNNFSRSSEDNVAWLHDTVRWFSRKLNASEYVRFLHNCLLFFPHFQPIGHHARHSRTIAVWELKRKLGSARELRQHTAVEIAGRSPRRI